VIARRGSVEADPEGGVVVEHYVVFRAKAGSESALDAALATFADGIRDLDDLVEHTWGRNDNPASSEAGWTHGMLVRLAAADALEDAYRHHPAHLVLMDVLRDITEARFAIDYEV
jgi:Stress responsive A/B Barrel Domain